MIAELDQWYWKKLHGRLWHTTRPASYKQVAADKAILLEPLPGKWKRHQAPDTPRELWHYTRYIGGICLFDFGDSSPELYDEKYPVTSWRHYVPSQDGMDPSIWIEIDRAKVAENLLSGEVLRIRRKRTDKEGNKIFPEIESAHLGNLPASAFVQVLKCYPEDERFECIFRNPSRI